MLLGIIGALLLFTGTVQGLTGWGRPVRWRRGPLASGAGTGCLVASAVLTGQVLAIVVFAVLGAVCAVTWLTAIQVRGSE